MALIVSSLIIMTAQRTLLVLVQIDSILICQCNGIRYYEVSDEKEFDNRFFRIRSWILMSFGVKLASKMVENGDKKFQNPH